MNNKSGKDKMRKNNFTRPEVAALIQYVRRNQKNLLGKAGHCANKVEERKRKIWKGAVEALRVTGGPPRDWKEIKKKWHQLKCTALAYNKHKENTGEGPKPAYNKTHEAVLEALAPQAVDGTVPSSDSEDESQSTTQSQQSPAPVDLPVPVENDNVAAELAGIGASGSRPGSRPWSRPSPSSEMDEGESVDVRYLNQRRIMEAESVDFFTMLVHQQVELLEKISDKMDTVIGLLQARTATSTVNQN